MNEIDRILQEIFKNLDKHDGSLPTREILREVKAGLVKAAYVAAIYDHVALSVCAYVEKKSKETSNAG